MSNRDYRNPQSWEIYSAYIGDLGTLPFSFVYNNKRYTGFDQRNFTSKNHSYDEANGKRRDTFTLQADDNLTVVVDMAYYEAYGAYEWTVWFKNIGTSNTGVIHSIKAADMRLEGSKPTVRGILGDLVNLYRPYEHALSEGGVCFASTRGRPTHMWFPYFNLEHGDGGTLISLGWGGTWSASFCADYGGDTTLFTATGTLDLCTYLKPGEAIRSPLMTFVPYTVRDETYATNLWRSFYIDCNLPRRNAARDALEPFSTVCFSNDTGLPNSDGSISERHFTWKPSLDKMLSEGIRPDYRWVDAGWYCDPHGQTVPSDWWGTVGTWQVDQEKWPNGTFREAVDVARSHGIKTLLWFEPERVTQVDGLVQNYGYKAEWGLALDDRTIFNNIGDDDCLQWTLDRILSTMGANDLDMYREDNNNHPAPHWALGDEREGEGRYGITENKAVVGHYKLWDGIIADCAKRGRDTFVDSCASGGGRNDLESMRRGIPLLRSDSDRTTTAIRLSMNTAFNKWIPFCGTIATEQPDQLSPDGVRDPYILRASYNPVFITGAQWTQNPNETIDVLRGGFVEWEKVKMYLLKDFYTLTPWNAPEDRTHWTSYLYFDPEIESGALFAFRMEECTDESCTIQLPMLHGAHTYELTDADCGSIGQFSGAALAEGYTFTSEHPRTATLIYITRRS